MIKEMKKLYEDKSSYVAIAAAITLFSIDRADQRVATYNYFIGICRV